ncbi:hypothetical protein NPIL_525131 [Nephila pilipes]|uniref:Uncharacterized protein n=1 Tax=Nephila pilipes TaxID=299642 RepID=A0A8X6P9Y0_NEPPI|nr:hypothetical protein NPIL_525131 [Nephila pilipes]
MLMPYKRLGYMPITIHHAVLQSPPQVGEKLRNTSSIDPHTLSIMLEEEYMADLGQHRKMQYFETIHDIWFQHEWVPTNFSALVCDLLDMEYPGHWIGRGVCFYCHHNRQI